MQSPQQFVSVFYVVKIRPAFFADLSLHVQMRHVLLIHHRRIAQAQSAVVTQNVTIDKRAMPIVACSVPRGFAHLILEIPDRFGKSIRDLVIVELLFDLFGHFDCRRIIGNIYDSIVLPERIKDFFFYVRDQQSV